MEVSPGLTSASSHFDLRRQSELPSPETLKNFFQNYNRRPSWLEKERSTCHCCSWSLKAKAYKNLLGVSVSYWIIFSAFLAVVGLQSSLNQQDGLGLASLCTLYTCFVFSGLFTSSVVRLFGTKYNLVMCYIVMLIYTLSNFYPHWYTLIPGSICLGLAFGPLWASLNVHITTVAIRFAPALNETPGYVVALFTGIHTFFYKMSYIPANLASSAILFSERTVNSSDGGPLIDTSLGTVCNNTEAANVDRIYIYILFSIYVVFDIVAIIICLSFVDHLGTNTRFHTIGKMFTLYFKKPFIATIKMFTEWKMLMILPMMILDGFVISFALGQFAKFYISDCIGVHWIGLVQMAFGICSAISAVSAGRLVKCMPQYIIVYTTIVLNLTIILFLLFWDRVPSYPVTFITLACWGLCDGIWNSIPPGLVGTIFSDKQEAAFSVLRMGLAVGFITGFLGALVLDFNVQLYISLCYVIVTAITYSILLFVTQSKEQLLPCCFRNKEDKTNELSSEGQIDNNVPKLENITKLNTSDEDDISKSLSATNYDYAITETTI